MSQGAGAAPRQHAERIRSWLWPGQVPTDVVPPAPPGAPLLVARQPRAQLPAAVLVAGLVTVAATALPGGPAAYGSPRAPQRPTTLTVAGLIETAAAPESPPFGQWVGRVQGRPPQPASVLLGGPPPPDVTPPASPVPGGPAAYGVPRDRSPRAAVTRPGLVDAVAPAAPPLGGLLISPQPRRLTPDSAGFPGFLTPRPPLGAQVVTSAW